MRLICGAIFQVSVPAVIIRSDWRGEGRMTSIPQRDISKREPAVAISSKAQQAGKQREGQREDLRAQLTTISADARTTLWETSSSSQRLGSGMGPPQMDFNSSMVLPSERSRSLAE